MDDSVIVENLSKSFRLYHEKSKSVFDLVRTAINKNPYEMLHVLNDVSFSVKKGEMVGILGRNGITDRVPQALQKIVPPIAKARNKAQGT